MSRHHHRYKHLIFIRYLLSFSMHYCTFAIIGKHDDPETAVARAFEPFNPFNEDLEVEPYGACQICFAKSNII